MIGFYNFLETIQGELSSSPFINTVTYGNINDADLAKKTIFPLGHFVVNNVSYQENILVYNISILLMDIVDVSKEAPTDIFKGNDNEQDVFNTQLGVAVRLLDELKRGDLYKSKFQLNGNPTIEPFVDRIDNKLAGWAITFDVTVINELACK